MMDIVRDGLGRTIPMGTELIKAKGFTTLDVGEKNDLYCAFEFDDYDGTIDLTFQSQSLARRLIELVSAKKLSGLSLVYRTPDGFDRSNVKAKAWEEGWAAAQESLRVGNAGASESQNPYL